ncbi:hypothetical protein B0O99DRAFT_588223 [Bisporella sp. PMI_857]|nr:hypothetical protein B0O99DRAFT_588223 [Bisporella sp. PMI_857]
MGYVVSALQQERIITEELKLEVIRRGLATESEFMARFETIFARVWTPDPNDESLRRFRANESIWEYYERKDPENPLPDNLINPMRFFDENRRWSIVLKRGRAATHSPILQSRSLSGSFSAQATVQTPVFQSAPSNTSSVMFGGQATTPQSAFVGLDDMPNFGNDVQTSSYAGQNGKLADEAASTTGKRARYESGDGDQTRMDMDPPSSHNISDGQIVVDREPSPLSLENGSPIT